MVRNHALYPLSYGRLSAKPTLASLLVASAGLKAPFVISKDAFRLG